MDETQTQKSDSNESTQEQKNRETLRNGISAAVIVFTFIGIFFYAIVEEADKATKLEKKIQNQSDTDYFLTGGAFICSSSPPRTSPRYLVSKENGWEIYDTDYFKKEDLLMTFMSCSRTAEQKIKKHSNITSRDR